MDATIDSPQAAGPHYHYVASREYVPTTNNETRQFGLDIGNAASNTLDGTVDNQFGFFLSVLHSDGIDAQTFTDGAVSDGAFITLIDVQTSSFSNEMLAGFTTYAGNDPNPPPCIGSGAATTCGHHLMGTATFGIDTGTVIEPPVIGRVVNGTFSGGPGTLSVALSLVPVRALRFTLANARVRFTNASSTQIGIDESSGPTGGAILAGAIARSEVDGVLLPDLTNQIAGALPADCTMPSSPPGCGCATGSFGAVAISLFDANPHDCLISLDEVRQSGVVSSLLAPDVCLESACNAPDGVSFGMQVIGVSATFTGP